MELTGEDRGGDPSPQPGMRDRENHGMRVADGNTVRRLDRDGKFEISAWSVLKNKQRL